MSGMITALDIAYEEKERRGFFKLNMIALGLTLGLMVGGIVVIALVAVLPAVLQLLLLGPATKWVLLVVEWPLLIVLVTLGLAVLYRYAPDRDKPQWRWVSPGAITATILWIVASIGFTVYVANFNSYDKTYGSLGGVIILLTWLYLSVLTVLFGAVINAQSEKQTRKDSTEGSPQAMGQRDARAADTLGESRGALMAENKEIDRLKRRLKWEAPGPLTDLSNQMTASAVLAPPRAGAVGAPDSAEEMPLISLLMAFEAGFAVARLGTSACEALTSSRLPLKRNFCGCAPCWPGRAGGLRSASLPSYSCWACSSWRKWLAGRCCASMWRRFQRRSFCSALTS